MKLRPNHDSYEVPLGWITYALMMFVMFLVLTFPYDPLHALLLIRLSEQAGIDIHAERWSLRLPAGILWIHPSILVPGLTRLDAEQIQGDLKIGSLLRGQPAIMWSGRLGGPGASHGLMKAELSWASFSWSGPAQILGSVEHFDLSPLELPLVKKGLLRTRFERRWTGVSVEDRSFLEEGTWHIELSEVELALEQVPIHPESPSSLTLSSLSGRLECHSGTCRVDSVRGDSPDGMLSGEGELVLQHPLTTSHLTLILSVIMTEAMKERLHFISLGPMTPGLPQKITFSGPLSHLHVSL